MKCRMLCLNDHAAQVSQPPDVVTLEWTELELQENFSDISAVIGNARRMILAAQFECYLKIIHDPPWSEAGNRTV